MRISRTAAAGLLSAFALVFAFASPAGSAPGGGVQRETIDTCFISGDFDVCIQGEIFTKRTENPNVVLVLEQSSTTVTVVGIAEDIRGCTSSIQLDVKRHIVSTIEGDTIVTRFTNEGTLTSFTCPGDVVVTCDVSTEFHMANGQVQYSRVEEVCQPS